jgi:uncharacterized protein DUF6086
MSQFFDLDGVTLWNPSNGAARLFLRHVALYEAELELPSGIGSMENDEAAVDPVAFRAFVEALVAWQRSTTHSVLLALPEGFVATVLVLAERAGLDVPEAEPGRGPGHGPGHVDAGLRDRARALGRSMSR